MKEYLFIGFIPKLIEAGKLHIAVYYIAIVLCAVIGYLLGSVNPAIIISKLKYHDDIRTHGSGNAGSTNMLRTYGKGAAALTLLCDFLKCAVAVLLARFLCGYDWGALAGMCCAIGHAFPCFYGFKGGKCVAVTASMLLCMEPVCFLIALVVFVLIVLFTKYVSLASVITAMLMPVVYYNFFSSKYHIGHGSLAVGFLFVACMLLVFLHRENISRLREGKEHKIGEKRQ